MPRPYPQALRERVRIAHQETGATEEELAERFLIGHATVGRWLSLDRRTGSVAPLPMGGARHPRKVDAAGETFLRELLDLLPDSTLGELCRAYEDHCGVRMDERTMGRSLARMNLTKKKGR